MSMIPMARQMAECVAPHSQDQSSIRMLTSRLTSPSSQVLTTGRMGGFDMARSQWVEGCHKRSSASASRWSGHDLPVSPVQSGEIKPHLRHREAHELEQELPQRRQACNGLQLAYALRQLPFLYIAQHSRKQPQEGRHSHCIVCRHYLFFNLHAGIATWATRAVSCLRSFNAVLNLIPHPTAQRQRVAQTWHWCKMP